MPPQTCGTIRPGLSSRRSQIAWHFLPPFPAPIQRPECELPRIGTIMANRSKRSPGTANTFRAMPPMPSYELAQAIGNTPERNFLPLPRGRRLRRRSKETIAPHVRLRAMPWSQLRSLGLTSHVQSPTSWMMDSRPFVMVIMERRASICSSVHALSSIIP